MPAEATPSDVSALLVATRKALHEQRFGAAAETALTVLAATSDLQRLERIFTESRRIDLFVQLVWAHRESTLRGLSAVAIFMRMCAVDQTDMRLRELRYWLLDESTAPITFPYLPFLNSFNKIGDRQLVDLFLFKYKGWDQSSPEKLAESVDALADRCEIPQYLAQFLYDRRAGRDLDFPGWLHDVRSAQVIGHFFRDALLAASLVRNADERDRPFLKQFHKRAALASNVDMARAKLFFDGLDTSRGLVLCTFHGAFSVVLKNLFRRLMPDHYSLGGDQAVRNGQRAAAFRAVKALMQKKAVLIAPDGPHFGEAAGAEIRVFGQPFRISVGAALIAYEADSDTCWCNMVREHEQLALVYVPGPRRSPGETFKQFRERWLVFYTAQIEATLSSDPKNLELRSAKWSSFGVPRKD